MGLLDHMFYPWLTVSTNVPDLNSYFESFQRWYEEIDDRDARAFSPDQFWPVLRIIKGVGVFGSSLCVILNSLLILAIMSSKQTRNLTFFPVIFQATIDILGPGIANIAYEIRSYRQLFEHLNQNYLTQSGSKNS